MADTLLIRLAPAQQGIRDWLLIDTDGQVKTPSQAGTPPGAVVAGARRVVVLVPGEDVTLLEARVPGRNRQRVLRAIPFALEEQLAADVAELHFALGPARDNGHYPVAVVDRRQMDHWAALLQTAGISAHQWIPETLALPHREGWSLLPDGERILVRSGDYSGFGGDADSLPTLVSLLAGSEDLPEKAHVFGPANVDIVGIEIERDETPLQPLELLARGWSQGPVIDLLQGAYSRQEEWGRLFRPWKASAALFLAVILVAGSVTGINYYRLSQQQTQMNADIRNLYKQTFPDARRIVNPRAQMEQQLKRLQRRTGGSHTDFLTLFATTANLVRTATGIAVQGASYRDGRLDLDLQADNLQLLDALKQQLVKQGHLQAEIQSATTDANQKVKSRIRIEGKAS